MAQCLIISNIAEICARAIEVYTDVSSRIEVSIAIHINGHPESHPHMPRHTIHVHVYVYAHVHIVHMHIYIHMHIQTLLHIEYAYDTHAHSRLWPVEGLTSTCHDGLCSMKIPHVCCSILGRVKFAYCTSTTVDCLLHMYL